jgi:hypothetical protein
VLPSAFQAEHLPALRRGAPVMLQQATYQRRLPTIVSGSHTTGEFAASSAVPAGGLACDRHCRAHSGQDASQEAAG